METDDGYMEVLGYVWNEADQYIECFMIKMDGVLKSVPDNMGNRHRRYISEWEALGNVVPQYVP